MLIASLVINIVVLLPVCWALLTSRPDIDRVFGKDSTARQILVCIYLSILALSLFILIARDTKMVIYAVPLLALQITYKFLSGILIRDKSTPVLWFNLAIATFHAATLFSIWSVLRL